MENARRQRVGVARHDAGAKKEVLPAFDPIGKGYRSGRGEAREEHCTFPGGVYQLLVLPCISPHYKLASTGYTEMAADPEERGAPHREPLTVVEKIPDL